MAIENEVEEALYKALRDVWALPRPKLRVKILINAMKAIAPILGYELVWTDKMDGG